MDAAASGVLAIAGRVSRERSSGVQTNDAAKRLRFGFEAEHTPAVESQARTSADGEVVWSWRPKLASSRAEATSPDRVSGVI